MGSNLPNSDISVPPTRRERLYWLDAAKAIGMFLVFYGHFVERIHQYRGAEAAFPQVKLIYAFHMVMFVVLAGYLARTDFPRPVAFLRGAITTRLIPVVFFSVLLLPVHYWDRLPEDVDETPTVLDAHRVRNWQRLRTRIAPPDSTDHHPARAALYRVLPETVRASLHAAAAGDSISVEAREAVFTALNEAFGRPDLFDVEAQFAQIGLPPGFEQLQERGPPESLMADDLRRHNILLYWKALHPRWSPKTFTDLFHSERTWRGLNEFNISTWFLIALFTIECLHFVVGRLLVGSMRRVIAAIPFFAVIGWYATLDMPLFIGDIWFVRESLLLYAFYLFGLALNRSGVMGWFAGSRAWVLLVLPGAALVTIFDLNPGAADLTPMVLINLSRHGDPLWFAVGAVSGTLMVFGLAHLFPRLRVINFVGRNSLSFLCLNGLFFSFLNKSIAKAGLAPEYHVPLFLWATLVSILSITACAPVIMLVNRWLPQLIGRPRQRGPLLPPLA